MSGAPVSSSWPSIAPFPLRLAVVALLSVLWGLYSVYSVIADYQRGVLSINLGVLLLPLGIGVLLRSNGCRVVLAVVTLLALLIAPLLLCLAWSMAGSGSGTFFITWFGRRIESPTAGQVVLAHAVGAVWWLLTLWCYRVLRSERSRAACGQSPRFVI